MNVLVLGATGKTGRPVVQALAARGVTVRAASRHPGTAAGTVEPTRFDWADRATWELALRGADGLYVVGPYAQPDPEAVLRELLVAAGDVRRVVLLSVLGADRLPAVSPMAGWERVVRESGKQWTILRPNWFQQNFGEGFAASLRDSGTLELPAGDAPLSFVDTRDIADVAAVALTEDNHHGYTYQLTGPQSLTYGRAVAALGEAVGRDLRYLPVTAADFAGRLRRSGVNEVTITRQLALFDLIRDGVNAPLTGTVERVTGHPARSLTAYVAEQATTWVAGDLIRPPVS